MWRVKREEDARIRVLLARKRVRIGKPSRHKVRMQRGRKHKEMAGRMVTRSNRRESELRTQTHTPTRNGEKEEKPYRNGSGVERPDKRQLYCEGISGDFGRGRPIAGVRAEPAGRRESGDRRAATTRTSAERSRRRGGEATTADSRKERPRERRGEERTIENGEGRRSEVELPLLAVKINGKAWTALLDTGAIRSFIKSLVCKATKLKEKFWRRRKASPVQTERGCACRD